jgi:hypothetical protein
MPRRDVKTEREIREAIVDYVERYGATSTRTIADYVHSQLGEAARLLLGEVMTTNWTAFEYNEVRFMIAGAGAEWELKVEDVKIEQDFTSFQQAYDYAVAYINGKG